MDDHPSEVTDRAGAGDRLLPTRLLVACGIAAPIILAVGTFLSGLTWEGYSHQAQMISELGGQDAPVPALQNFVFFLVGTLVVAFSVSLYRATRSRWGTLLVGYFGMTLLALPVFPCDPGCAFETSTGIAHNVVALIGFVAVIAGIAVFSKQLAWRRYTQLSALLAVGAFTLFVVWNVSIGMGFEDQSGSLQRLFIGSIFLWVFLVAIRLRRVEWSST